MRYTSRSRPGWSPLCIALVALSLACDDERAASPQELLSQAANTLGTPSALAAVGPFATYASGTMDKSAEGQGHSPSTPSPGPYEETIAVDPGGAAVLWSYVETRYDGTRENFGEAYPSDTLHYLLINDAGVAVPFTRSSFAQERQRLRRRFPHLLVREMLEHPQRLQLVPSTSGFIGIQGFTIDDNSVVVSLDSSTWLVRQVELDVLLPGRGMERVQWWFDDYREFAGLLQIPHFYGSRIGELPYTDMNVDSVVQRSDMIFQTPANLQILPTRNAMTEDQSAPTLELRELAANVFTFPNVRSGFAPLIVEFDTFLVVVDAPASFPLLGQIPPSETDPGSSISWATERFVDAVNRERPTKRIEYAVLTHHHEDHIGGIRALVAAGVTILASPTTLQVVRRLVDLPHETVNDRLAVNVLPLKSESILQRRSIVDEHQALEIVDIGSNPHADGMLVIVLPRLNTLYVSDLVTPGPLDDYPAPNHAALDRFFAGWLRQNGIAPDSIWSMHGSGVILRDHLNLLTTPKP